MHPCDPNASVLIRWNGIAEGSRRSGLCVRGVSVLIRWNSSSDQGLLFIHSLGSGLSPNSVERYL
jgi:hypothetical protein